MSNMPENIRRMWEEAANIKSTRPEPRLPDDLVKRGPKPIDLKTPDDLIKGGPKRPTLASLERPMRRKTDSNTASKGKPMVPVSPLHSKEDIKGYASVKPPVKPPVNNIGKSDSIKHNTKSKPMVPPPHSPLN